MLLSVATMNADNDTEELARLNLAVYYTAVEMLKCSSALRANAESRLIGEAIWCEGGLSQFANAQAMAAELAPGSPRSRLMRKGVRTINRLIRLAKELRRSRFVEVSDWGLLVLAGSNGIVPRFLDGMDWVMTEPKSETASVGAVESRVPGDNHHV